MVGGVVIDAVEVEGRVDEGEVGVGVLGFRDGVLVLPGREVEGDVNGEGDRVAEGRVLVCDPTTPLRRFKAFTEAETQRRSEQP